MRPEQYRLYWERELVGGVLFDDLLRRYETPSIDNALYDES